MKLSLYSTCTATTYVFSSPKQFGWACCTVNDATGELLTCTKALHAHYPGDREMYEYAIKRQLAKVGR